MTVTGKKLWLLLILAAWILIDGCTLERVSSASAPSPQIQYTDTWPENPYTSQIPKPENAMVQWVMEQPDGFVISLTQASRTEAEEYLEKLSGSGFGTVKKQVLPDTIIYLGTNGIIAVSLQYTQGSAMGIYLSSNLQGTS